MVENRYKFLCPVGGEAVAQDCTNIHHQMMVGNAKACPETCAIAHRAGKCAWAIMERRVWQARQPTPFSATETPAHKLDEDVLRNVMSAKVIAQHYAGVCPPGKHDLFFEELVIPSGGQKTPESLRSGERLVRAAKEAREIVRGERRPAAVHKPQTALDAVSAAAASNDLAAVVNKQIEKEAAQRPLEASLTAEEPSQVEAQPQPAPGRVAASGEPQTAMPMTLAEKARLMRARRQGNG